MNTKIVREQAEEFRETDFTRNVIALCDEVERLQGVLDEIWSMAHSHISSYNRNGPEWTSDQGTELYSASFVVESHTEIADVARAALSTQEQTND